MYTCPHCHVTMTQQTKDDYYGFDMWWECPQCHHKTDKVWYHADYFWESDDEFEEGEFE